ncbi:Uncharacterised protein [Mycobacterium tuberculosis]|nr:Uncharacterised protein [Mycobacterium tuberculosis]SGC00127.1 Uncharacterised protein [Mycobacterium tuberculosis]SGC48273.1 Uncharacterised protein [Mycobacterium tuberculosis]SGC48832.1 Uncharacterised protein [Mycobacterium tuberculosis]SGD80730.1 Uncharacterised protein [Mycobacterium tuberculosis]
MHVIGWPRLGLLLGPAVVRLTGGRTLHLVDKPQTARHFVARDLGAHERVQLGQRRPTTRPGLHHGGHLLAVTRIGHPDHQSVEHVGMPLQSGLDLFGVDLLAAAVDRHRATTQHGDRAVLLDLGVVPRNGVAHIVNRPERLGRLLLVLVVADGNVALLGERARGSHCLAPGAPVAGRLLPRALQVRCGITRKPAHIR